MDSSPRFRHYDAYGVIAEATDGARLGFTGEASEPDTGWLVLGSRPYLPSLRGLVSPDAASPFDAGGLNRYAYCAGDPVNRIDPTGNSFWDWLGVAAGIAGTVIGTAMTGGALLGAIAAAGSLSAAIANASMVTLAVAALEATSVVAEIGSLATMASGDDAAGGIFGWVAFGTGMAAGISGVTGALRKVGGSSKKAGVGGILFPSHVKLRMKYRRSTYDVDVDQKIKVFTGRGIAERHLGDRVTEGQRGKVDISPAWTQYENSRGGINYVTDVAVGAMEVNRTVYRFSHRDDGLPLVILTGVHGASNGSNWWRGRRIHKEKKFLDLDVSQVETIFANAGGKHDLYIIDIGGLNERQFRGLMEARAHVVHSYCYSAADWQVMRHFRIREANIYTV